MNLLIRGAHLVDPKSKRDEVLDVLIVHGKISKIGKSLSEIDGIVPIRPFSDLGKDGDTKAAREVFEKEAANVKEDMRAKVVEGKLDAFLKERVLLDQPFVKDAEITIRQLIENGVQKFGEKIEVVRMERLSVK